MIGSLAGPRADLAAATAGGRLVLLGGFDGSGPLSSVLIGSGATRFRTLTRLPQAVRYPAVAVSGGDVYLFGGLLAGGEYTGTFTLLIQQVDPATGTTRIAGRLPYPVAHAKAVVLRGQILILGGSTPRGPTSDILRFDPARRGVTRVGQAPRAQHRRRRGRRRRYRLSGRRAVRDRAARSDRRHQAPLDHPGPQRGLALWAVMRARCRYVNDLQIGSICARRHQAVTPVDKDLAAARAKRPVVAMSALTRPRRSRPPRPLPRPPSWPGGCSSPGTRSGGPARSSPS